MSAHPPPSAPNRDQIHRRTWTGAGTDKATDFVRLDNTIQMMHHEGRMQQREILDRIIKAQGGPRSSSRYRAIACLSSPPSRRVSCPRPLLQDPMPLPSAPRIPREVPPIRARGGGRRRRRHGAPSRSDDRVALQLPCRDRCSDSQSSCRRPAGAARRRRPGQDHAHRSVCRGNRPSRQFRLHTCRPTSRPILQLASHSLAPSILSPRPPGQPRRPCSSAPTRAVGRPRFPRRPRGRQTSRRLPGPTRPPWYPCRLSYQSVTTQMYHNLRRQTSRRLRGPARPRGARAKGAAAAGSSSRPGATGRVLAQMSTLQISIPILIIAGT